MIAILVLATLLLAQPTSAGGQQPVPRFEPGECRFEPPAGIARPDCGWLVVPEIRGNARSRTLRLAVAVYRARTGTQAPPLLLLHGGPGGDGGVRASLPAFQDVLRSPLAASRDIVTFDVRGAGLSEPSLCPDFHERATPALNRRLADERARGYADAVRACAAWMKDAGIERTAYSTEVNAADAIDLRRLLGYSTWDLFGVAYGGRIAQVLMALDAGAIRAIVLVNPATMSGTEPADMAFTHQRALERVFTSCAARPECQPWFPTLSQDFDALHEEFSREPFEVRLGAAGEPTSVWLDGARFVLDTRRHLTFAAASRLPLLIDELRRGDRARAAAELVGDGRMDPFHPLTHLVGCNDYGADYPDAVDRIRPQLRPAFQSIADDLRERCSGWFERLMFRRDLTIPGDIPTLMLNGEIDPHGPDWHSRQLATGFTQAYVHDIRGRGHEALGPCAQSIIDQFLLQPAREPDASCIVEVPPLTFVTDRSGR
jgi:pimeloyl-ACP methyl ester carboxylesterase